jgi:hypothetical protein
VETNSSGQYVSLVVRLQAASDGTWYLDVDGSNTAHTIPLLPMTLVVRLWRAGQSGPLRGTIRLHGTDHWAPIQSNGQLEQLVRAWLLSGESATGVQ